MSETTTIIILAIVSLIASLIAGLKSIRKFKSWCCQSECTRPPSVPTTPTPDGSQKKFDNILKDLKPHSGAHDIHMSVI
jgi:hypothetical protein